MHTNGYRREDERTVLVERLCAVADALTALPDERVPDAVAALSAPADALFRVAEAALDARPK